MKRRTHVTAYLVGMALAYPAGVAVAIVLHHRNLVRIARRDLAR